MLRLVSFPRNSHVLRHLLSIKFADKGTAVTIALVHEQTFAWSRHATCLVTKESFHNSHQVLHHHKLNKEKQGKQSSKFVEHRMLRHPSNKIP